jgi:hypothetical protein
MMPDEHSPQTNPESSPTSSASAQPTMSSTRPTLDDLSTGGRWGPVTDLPTSFGRPLARLGKAIRARGTAWMPSWGRGASKGA